MLSEITKMKSNKWINEIVLMLIIVVLLSTCDTVNPEDGNGDNGGEFDDPIGTETIGSAGGEINLDSIIVKIPPNALDNDYEINIYAEDGSGELAGYSNSSLYKIRGLPNSINAPIILNIKYHDELDGDPMALVGELAYAVSLDSLLHSYRAIEAVDSSGYLVIELTGNQQLNKPFNTQRNILGWALNFIIPIGYVTTLSSNGNFRLSYPFFDNAQAVIMGEHFENAFAKCRAMGFSYPNRTFPIDVLVKALNGAYGLYTCYGADNMTDANLRSWIDSGSFTIGYSALNNNIELPVTCGHEFLHFVQNEYEFSSPWIQPEQSWMKEATSTWIEDKYAVNNNYISSAFLGREMYIFDGWQYNGRNYSEHGYGLPIIFKEISQKYGDNTIVQIFERIKNGALPGNAIDPVNSIKSVIEQREPLSDFWHRTLTKYISGDYFNNQVNFTILNNSFNYIETGVLDEQNQHQPVSLSMHDLSGQLVKVKTGDFGSMDKVPFTFIISDSINCGLTVFKFKEGQDIEQLDSFSPGGRGRLTVDDVKPFLNDGYEIIALISNGNHDINSNYQSISEIELTVEISSEPEIDFVVIKYFLNESSVNWTQIFPTETFSGVTSSFNERPATFGAEGDSANFDGIIFSYNWVDHELSTYDRLDVEGGYTGTFIANGNMTVTFHDSAGTIDVYMHQVRSELLDGSYNPSGPYNTKFETEVTLNFNNLNLVNSDSPYGYNIVTYAAYGSELHFLDINWVWTRHEMAYHLDGYHFPMMYIMSLNDFDRNNDSEFVVEVHYKQETIYGD